MCVLQNTHQYKSPSIRRPETWLEIPRFFKKVARRFNLSRWGAGGGGAAWACGAFSELLALRLAAGGDTASERCDSRDDATTGAFSPDDSTENTTAKKKTKKKTKT